MSTHCTVVAMDFLRRFVALKQKTHASFYGRAEAYNYQHSYTDASSGMDHRRLIEGYFKFIYLDFRRRHSQPLVIKGNCFDELQTLYDDMYALFRRRYSTHFCDVTGCKSCILIDGHLKAHRKMCEIKMCKNDPKSKSIYCCDHAEKSLREVNLGIQELKIDEYHIERILSKRFDNE